ncbi:hypothetical protein AKO1_006701 [Acrasis kona]|uniref:BTB domain-containing protein n=1 Tax=Acrasis kona TaxID=1008807 RepID=A0AAW2ZJF2_9EUKA
MDQDGGSIEELFAAEEEEKRRLDEEIDFGPSDNDEYEDLSVEETLNEESIHTDIIKLLRRVGVYNVSYEGLEEAFSKLRSFIHGVIHKVVQNEEESENPSDSVTLKKVKRVCESMGYLVSTPVEKEEIFLSCFDCFSPSLLTKDSFDEFPSSDVPEKYSNNEQFFIVNCGERSFAILKCIVSIRCPVLYSWIESGSDHAVLLELKKDPDLFKLFVEYIYTEECDDDINGQKISQVLSNGLNCDFETSLSVTLLQPKYCNVIIKCRDGEISVNQQILMIGSRFFKTMFESNFCSDKVIDLSELCSLDSARLLINYLYGDKIEVTDMRVASELLTTCDYLLVSESFIVYCQLCITNMISIDNIIDVYKMCSVKNTQLFNYVECFIASHLDKLDLSTVLNAQELSYFELISEPINYDNVLDRHLWASACIKNRESELKLTDVMYLRLEEHWIPEYKEYINQRKELKDKAEAGDRALSTLIEEEGSVRIAEEQEF